MNDTSNKKRDLKDTGLLLASFTWLLTIVLFLINYFRNEDGFNLLSFVYYVIASVGYSFVFTAILYLIFYLPISLVTRSEKLSSFIYIIFGIILQIILLIDGFVYAIYNYHLNISIIELFFKAGTDIFVFDIKLRIIAGLIIFFVAILPYLLIYKYRRILCEKLKFTRPKVNRFVLLLLICFVTANFSYLIGRKYNQILIVKSSDFIPLFQSGILNKFLIKWNLSQQDEIDHTMFLVPRREMNYPLHAITGTDSIPNYNIVFILVDSWNIRAFNEEVTPNISKFSKNSELFTKHFSSANATIGGVFGMFYSLPFSYEDSAKKEKVHPVFFDRLKSLDYNIQMFSSAHLVLEDSVFDGLENINHDTEGNSAYERDIKLTDNAIDFINEQKDGEPFFSFLFYDLAHAISIPEEHRKQFQPSWDEPNYIALKNDMDPTPFFNLYRNCIYFIDQQVNRVLKTLEEKDMLKNTIVIITGDHGQEFNESKKNNWGHFSNYSNWQIQIPFMVYHPDLEKGEILSHATTHYDIVPTLMNRYLGVTNPLEDYAVGQDLYNTATRYPFWSGDFTIRTSLVFEDALATAEHGPGVLYVTDRNLQPLQRSIFDNRKNEFVKAQEQKERFYKRP